MRQPGKGANRHAVRPHGAVFACRSCDFITRNTGDVARHVVANQFPVVEEWPPKMGVSMGKEDGRYV